MRLWGGGDGSNSEGRLGEELEEREGVILCRVRNCERSFMEVLMEMVEDVRLEVRVDVGEFWEEGVELGDMKGEAGGSMVQVLVLVETEVGVREREGPCGLVAVEVMAAR